MPRIASNKGKVGPKSEPISVYHEFNVTLIPQFNLRGGGALPDTFFGGLEGVRIIPREYLSAAGGSHRMRERWSQKVKP